MTMTLPATPVVFEIDDMVDVAEVPAELAARAAAMVPAAELPAVLELIALLIERLGADSAIPVIHSWMTYTPSVLTSFPAPLRQELVAGTIAPLRPAHAAVSPQVGVSPINSRSAAGPGPQS